MSYEYQLEAKDTSYTAHNKHNWRKTNALNGIRKHVSSNQTPADTYLRPHGHWDRLSFVTKGKGKGKLHSRTGQEGP